MNKILLTGSSGFLAKYILSEIKDAVFIEFDLPKKNILNLKYLDKVFEKDKPNIVIHAAALLGGPKSLQDPYNYFSTNSFGTLNVCEFVRKYKIDKFIYISSCSFYKHSKKKINERGTIDLNHPYAYSKYLGEKIVRFYSEKYNFKTLCLRPNLITGYGCKKDNLIYEILKEIKEKNTATVFGDGKHIREFVHPKDIVSAIKLWIKKKNFSNCEIYNISTNRIKILDLIKKIIFFLKKGKIIYQSKNNRVFSIKLNSFKIKSKLKWRPKYDINYLIRNNYEQIKEDYNNRL